MSVNPALGLIGMAVIGFLIFSNKKMRFIAFIAFAFMFTLHVTLDNPKAVTDSLAKTIKPVTGVFQKCQAQMETGAKTCDFGSK